MIEAAPVYGPVAKRSRFAFERLETPDELRLDYDVTILPPKKLFFPPAQDLLRFDGGTFSGGARAGGEDPLRRPFLRRQGDRPDGPAVLGAQLRRQLHGAPPDHHDRRLQHPDGLQAGVLRLGRCGRGGQGARRLPHADRRRLRVRAVDRARRGACSSSAASSPPPTPSAGRRDKVNADALAKCPEKLEHGTEAIAAKVRAAFKDEELWSKLATDCFSCGSCNTVCPTCYCFDVQDTWNVDQRSGQRTRYWDACLTEDFAKVSLGEGATENFREDAAASASATASCARRRT